MDVPKAEVLSTAPPLYLYNTEVSEPMFPISRKITFALSQPGNFQYVALQFQKAVSENTRCPPTSCLASLIAPT